MEQRRELLKKLMQREFRVEVAKKLGISRASLYRYVRGERDPPASLDVKLCEILDEDEVLAVINNEQLLRSLGIIKDGQVNVPLLITLVDVALEHPQTQEIILKRIAKRYKTELQELLSSTLPRIEMKWTIGFEKYLTEKKAKPISERTLKDYRNIWYLCLEGKTLGWHLLKQLEGKQMKCKDGEYHPTNWARQVFRHYIRYLYSVGRLDWDSYSRLMIAVPGRKYGRKILQKPIKIEDVKRTLLTLKEKRMDIYTLYLFILYSATRFEHTLRLFKEWNPGEVVYVPYLTRNVRRLECPTSEFCRYYAGREHDKKPVGFAYFPKHLLTYINMYRDRLPNKRRIEKIVKRYDGLMPKFVRTYAIREMKRVFRDTVVFKFITSKFGEMTVSERHYLYIIDDADKLYPEYVKHLNRVLGDAVAFTA